MNIKGDTIKTWIEQIDAENAQDPNTEIADGKSHPKELLYAERMTHWLAQLEPGASIPLQLAARAQHLRRWVIPRSDYPAGKRGYYQWRTTLYRFHADEAGRVLSKAGCDETTISRTQALLRKEKIKQDAEMQTLEDVALSLVFLESYFADFSREHDEDKLVTIIRKTWRKMSPRGHDAALKLPLSEHARALVEKALAARSDNP